MLPKPVSLRYLKNQLPQWGFLKMTRCSVSVPPNIIKKLENFLDIKTDEDNERIPDIDEAYNSVPEGSKKWTAHLRRERNKKIVRDKKDQVLRVTGKLECETCKFDFKKRYGNLGSGFVEVHHILPLSAIEAEIETKLEDLAILCSNCHRMIHRTKPMWGVIELRKLYIKDKCET